MFPKAESTVHCAPSQLTPTQVYHIYFHSRQSDCHEQIRGCLYRRLELFHPGKNIALKKHNDPVSNHCSTPLLKVYHQTVAVLTLIHPWYTRHQLDMDADYLPFLNTQQQSSLSLVFVHLPVDRSITLSQLSVSHTVSSHISCNAINVLVHARTRPRPSSWQIICFLPLFGNFSCSKHDVPEGTKGVYESNTGANNAQREAKEAQSKPVNVIIP